MKELDVHSFSVRAARHSSARQSCRAAWPLTLAALTLLGTTVRSATAGANRAPDELVRELIRAVGSPRGFGVVLGDDECRFAIELAKQSELVIYAQFADRNAVERARRAVDQAGFYGHRIFVDQGPLTQLHLATDLVDALIAFGDAASVPTSEVLRVLRPQAKAWLGSRQLTKPIPDGLDDWTHPYHGPDNNPASNDQRAKGPYLTHFLAEPHYAPLPQLAVASAGRVFKVFGHIAFKVREEPWLNTLAAFNGYNGAFLWRREITPGLMVHRNTLIATPTMLYFGDEKSCKVIEAGTGRLIDEISVPEAQTGGTFWKWMALDEGVLYAMIGEDEPRDPVIRMRSNNHGWPWDPLSPGFNRSQNPWGYGRTMVAIDPKTKQVLWRYQEQEPFDSRATCLKNGRLFVFRPGAFLTCLDAKTGAPRWRQTPENAPDLFEAFGSGLNRQDWRTNWRTTAYAKCSDQALYFAGPTLSRLLAVSADSGRVLWQHPYNNYQLILQGGALYGLSGQIDDEVSRKFNPLTGEVLQEIRLGRRACTRPTSAVDAIFCRANGGSTRLDLASDQYQLVSPMRAQCQDGVTVANGLLYWWPSVCDCNLTLYGITCLGPADDLKDEASKPTAERLERGAGDTAVPRVSRSPADWPTFRADNRASAVSAAMVAARTRQAWRYQPAVPLRPTPPIAAAGSVFLSAADGIVRALDAATGQTRWTAYTGGTVRYPPTFWEGRVYVGSGDGWVYAFEASGGRLLWRFRAAPTERRIPVYGALLSTWPAASGVLVQDGVAYAAAGIVNYDGTHVYALDAVTGKVRWANNSSGHLDPDALAGVSVQGHMILHSGKLWLAGGNAVSPASYDLATGQCLNDPAAVHRVVNNNVPASESPRGSALYLVGDQVMVSDQPLYAHPEYKVYDASVLNKTWLATRDRRDYAWINDTRVVCAATDTSGKAQRWLENWGKPKIKGVTSLWEFECPGSRAVALAQNVLVIAGETEVVALDLQNGQRLWSQPLPARPVPWGLAVDRDGRVLVTLEQGEVICFAPDQAVASR